MRRFLTIIIPAFLILAGCGGDGGTIAARDTPTTVADGASVQLDPAVCEMVAGEDLPDDFVTALPERFREAAGVVVSFTKLMASVDGTAPNVAAQDLADQLAVDGIDEELTVLGDSVAESCGDEDAAQAFRLLGGITPLIATEKDTAYCEQLATTFESGGANDASGAQDEFDALAKVAPDAHRAAIEAMSAAATQEAPVGDAANDTAQALMGVGLYAEVRCGVKDAFAQMMIGAAFMGMGDDASEGAGTGSGDNADATGVEPTPADVSAAQGLAPAGLTFEAKRVDLEDDGRFLASVVVPVGWELDSGFNVSFDPPSESGFGFFTSLEVGAGCDGSCEATDWEARLRGPEGYLTNATADRTVSDERTLAGPEGVSLTATTSDGDVRVIVLRWDDTVSRYFQCVGELDADDAALASALAAACEASRPGWFPAG